MRPARRPPRGARARVRSVALAGPALLLAATACGASGPSGVSGTPTTAPAPSSTAPRSTTPSPAPSSTTIPAPASRTVAVTDAGGAAFVVTASPVTQTPTVSVEGRPRFAPPGQAYVVETLHVALAPGQGPRPFSDFDDPTSGLSEDVELVLDAVIASAQGFGADCGLEAGYPPSSCPVTFGQGFTVDSDSVQDPSGPTALVPGASVTIVLSYGPLPWSFPAGSLSVWFHSAPLAPEELSG